MYELDKPEEEQRDMVRTVITTGVSHIRTRVQVCRKAWWMGVILMGIASLFEAWSLAFTSLAVVAPLSGLTVVCNTIFAVYFLKETTNKIEIIAMAIIVGGAVMLLPAYDGLCHHRSCREGWPDVPAAGIALTSAFGPRSSEKFTIEQLRVMLPSKLVAVLTVMLVAAYVAGLSVSG